MKLSISEPLGDATDTFFQWAVTAEAIVVVLTNRAVRAFTLQARTWEGKQLWQTEIEQDEPWGLAVADDLIFLGSQSGAVHEFDLSSGATTSQVYLSQSSPTIIISTTHDPTGCLLVIASNHDSSIQVWNQATKTLRFNLSGVHLNAIFALEIKNNILISTGGPFVALWDLSTGKLIENYTCKDTPLFATLIISDELLAIGGLGGLISIFDRKTSKLITTITTNSYALNGLVHCRPNILLSTDTNGEVYLWSLETFQPINHVKMHEHSILAHALSNNTFITAGKEGGGAANLCGLDCSLKSCDMEMLLQGADVQPAEHGFPCQWLWAAQVVRERLVVCLLKRGRPCLDFWSLS